MPDQQYFVLGRAFVSDDFRTLIIAECSVLIHIPPGSIRVPLPEGLAEAFRRAVAETA